MTRILRLALAAPLSLALGAHSALGVPLALGASVALAAAGPEDKPAQSDGLVVPGTGPGTSAGGGPSDVGIKRAGSKADAEGRNKLVPTGFLTTDVIGIKVSDNAGNALGTVVDLVMEDGRTLTAVVLDIGGFLGVGTRYVAVQPAALILSPGGDRYAATLDMSKEQLGAAPDFKYSKVKPQN